MWTDDNRMHAESVIKVTEEFTNNLKKDNPNLNIDTQKLILPVLPPKATGPHNDVPNANVNALEVSIFVKKELTFFSHMYNF